MSNGGFMKHLERWLSSRRKLVKSQSLRHQNLIVKNGSAVMLFQFKRFEKAFECRVGVGNLSCFVYHFYLDPHVLAASSSRSHAIFRSLVKLPSPIDWPLPKRYHRPLHHFSHLWNKIKTINSRIKNPFNEFLAFLFPYYERKGKKSRKQDHAAIVN
jgi:hypothetical protein